MHLAALSQSVSGISCQKSSRSWFQFKWSFWTRESYISPSLSLSLSMCVYIYLAPPCAFHACNSSLPLYTRLFASLCINLAWLVGGEFDEARVNWRFRLSSYCCLVSIKFQRNDCSHHLDEFGRSNMGILSVKRETLREREGYYYRGILIVEIRKEIYERFVLNSLVYCKREIFHFLSWKCS